MKNLTNTEINAVSGAQNCTIEIHIRSAYDKTWWANIPFAPSINETQKALLVTTLKNMTNNSTVIDGKTVYTSPDGKFEFFIFNVCEFKNP